MRHCITGVCAVASASQPPRSPGHPAVLSAGTRRSLKSKRRSQSQALWARLSQRTNPLWLSGGQSATQRKTERVGGDKNSRAFLVANCFRVLCFPFAEIKKQRKRRSRPLSSGPLPGLCTSHDPRKFYRSEQQITRRYGGTD